MKPNKIFDVLDLTMKIREQNGKFNPLFVGAPGVGKSEIVQQWANANSLPFIDLRAAYLEAPDVIGFPSIEKNEEGRQVTVHNTPEFLPTSSRSAKGVLLLEEPNRGTTSVMNCFMQLLTDRKIHNYKLPDGWIIVACINPEGTEYDVNSMDPALKNRFEIFTVGYDKLSFVKYMKEENWHKEVVMFVESGIWQYRLPEEIGENANAKYVSPRTLSKLNWVLQAGVDNIDDELLYFQTILGNNVGRDFYNFRHNESPVLFKELVDHPREAFKRLEKFCDPNNLKNGMITITLQDIVDDNTIQDDLLVKLFKVLPAEHALGLVKELEFKRKTDLVTPLFKNYPEVKDLLKSVLKKS